MPKRELPIPLKASQVYGQLLETPGLCGGLTLVDECTLTWSLYPGFLITVSISPYDSCIEIQRLWRGKYPWQITHWHPELDELYQELCTLGRRGNVLVTRQGWMWETVLYCGPAEDCPYPPNRKWHWGKMCYLVAE